MLRESEWSIRQIIEREGSAWITKQQFWLFGTATYCNGTEINEQQVTRNARHFFNLLDRKIITRRDYNEGNRLQRLVFVEGGKTRTNTHLHFLIKGHKWHHYRQICSLAPAIWAKNIIKARDLVIEENFGLGIKRGTYCWKEYDDYDADSLLVDCCHLKNAN
jgi:predicted pyridoxine 5'-phosphate oxidase superfamily flavin-nucleotide-binding protein